MSHNLQKSLERALSFFRCYGYSEWEKETTFALNLLQQNDFSFVENLWLKSAPTCAIDELIITDYKAEEEPQINQHNTELALISNDLFRSLDKLHSSST